MPAQHAGELTPDFGTEGKLRCDLDHIDEARKLLVDEDRIYVLGQVTSVDSLNGYDYFIAAFTHAGTPDTSFGSGGMVRGDYPGYCLSRITDAVLWDNYLYVTGTGSLGHADTQDVVVSRFTRSGALDTAFAGSGFFRGRFLGPRNDAGGITVLDNGAIIVCGTTFDSNFVHKELPFFGRLTPEGIPDSAFTNGGFAVWDPASGFSDLHSYAGRPGRHYAGGGLLDAIALDGKNYFLCGYYTSSYFLGLNVLVNLDSILAPFESVYYPIRLDMSGFYSGAVVRNGQVIVSAEPLNNFGPEDFTIQCIAPDGYALSTTTVDFNFAQDQVKEIALDGQGRIAAAGYSRDLSHDAPGYQSDFFSIAVLENPLSPDLSFGDRGIVQYDFGLDDECGAVSIQAYDQYLYVAGYVNHKAGSNQSDIGILRIYNPVRPLGAAQPTKEGSLKLYPNPTAGKLYLGNTGSGVFDVQVFSMQGALVKEQTVIAPAGLDLGDLQSGNYLLKLATPNSISWQRVIVNH